MLKITVKTDRVARQIRALSSTPKERQRFLAEAARSVIKTARSRIKEQRSLDGGPFTAGKRKQKRLLRGLGKGLRVYSKTDSATVTYANTLTGVIARKHQEGFSEQYTASRAKKEGKRRGEPDYTAPATAAQADALVQEGYKRYMGKFQSGKKRGTAKMQRVSKKWIKENMTVGQAGFILRLMREKDAKTSWEVNVPARPFLGITENDSEEIIKKLVKKTAERVKRKR